MEVATESDLYFKFLVRFEGHVKPLTIPESLCSLIILRKYHNLLNPPLPIDVVTFHTRLRILERAVEVYPPSHHLVNYGDFDRGGLVAEIDSVEGRHS